MTVQRTFSIIKPDAVKKGVEDQINAIFEKAGLKIVAQEKLQLTTEQAQKFYEIHKERPFYGELVEFMTSGPVIVQVLEGEDAVALNRKLMGATNPAEAEEGTIRKLFADSIDANAVHGSDSEDNAKLEISQFFTEEQLAAA